MRVEVALRPQHYVQASAHAVIFLYWGWYWRPVYDSFPLLAAQVLFAYGLDAGLAWSRGRVYTLGFGPLPIVFSTNLFLWFKGSWWPWQFATIAVAFAGKALLRRDKDGRSAHIFNPSALALTVTSIVLLVTGSSDATWGREIAITQFYPPHMYAFLFAVALPGQWLFGVTTMTMSAVLATYAWGLAYFAATGTYYFLDSDIPIAVFLGMHLLFTDPSTSPRSELGRVMFGAIYGGSVVALYGALSWAGLPTFYDKLLQVPIMNLFASRLDRLAASRAWRPWSPARLWPSQSGRRRHLLFIGVWAAAFAAMSAAGGVGDRHPGQWVPFWQHACAQGRPRACSYLGYLQATLCRAGSGWSCNELGLLGGRGDGNPIAALASWQRGCELGFTPACDNAAARGEDEPHGAPPAIADLPILLRGSTGPVSERRPEVLRARAREIGF